MREDLIDLLIAVAASSGLSTLLVAFMSRGNKKSERRKIDIDSTQAVVDIWKKTAESLDKKLDEVKEERDELLVKVRELERAIDERPSDR